MTFCTLTGDLRIWRDLAREVAPREGVDREARRLADAQPADVGLVDRRLDLHVAQVLRDGEQHRRLQAGGHGLAGVDVAQDHRAVDRRADDGALEVDLRLLEQRLALLDGGLRAGDLRLAHPDLRLRPPSAARACVSNSVVALSSSAGEMKFLSTSVFLRSRSRSASASVTLTRADLGLLRGEAGARHRDRAARRVDVGARLVDAQLEALRVDLRDHLVLLHLRC